MTQAGFPRSLTARLVFAILLAVGGCGDDKPTSPESSPESAPDYFPYSVGSTWTYAWEDTSGAVGTDTVFVTVVAAVVTGQYRDAELLFEEHGTTPSSPDSGWHISYDVLPAADITVPAGAFHPCVPVRTTEYEDGYTDVDTDYFASGVGLVMNMQGSGSRQVLLAYRIEPEPRPAAWATGVQADPETRAPQEGTE